MGTTNIREVLGDDADFLLGHECKTIERDALNLPGPDFIDRVLVHSDRPIAGASQPAADVQPRPPRRHRLLVDPARGPGHRAFGGGELLEEPGLFRSRQASPSWPLAATAAPSPRHSAASASSPGGTPTRSRFIVKLNHNELLHLPATGATRCHSPRSARPSISAQSGVGATIYFGSEESTRQIREVSAMFAEAHRHGLFTVLWCYLRNPAFKTPEADYHLSADLTGQANHLGVTIEADIIKQKQPENNGGYTALEVRPHRSARLRPADDRPPHRPDPLAGRELLLGAYRPHQLRWRVDRAPATSPRRFAQR